VRPNLESTTIEYAEPLVCRTRATRSPVAAVIRQKYCEPALCSIRGHNLLDAVNVPQEIIAALILRSLILEFQGLTLNLRLKERRLVFELDGNPLGFLDQNVDCSVSREASRITL
jgi:hypothetical protein